MSASITDPSHALSRTIAQHVAQWPDPAASVVVVGLLNGGACPVASAGDLDADRRWASVTKLLTALTVLVLVHDGEADLDEELPESIAPPGATLSHLLDHTSGLDFEAGAPGTWRIRAAPGQRRIYSNTGIEVAAAHVEQLTEAPFAVLLRELVARPLGMTRTRLDGSAAHGLVAPTADLALLAGELLAPRVLPVAVVDALRTPSRPGLVGVLPGFGKQAHNDWGLGAEVRADRSPHWTSPRNDPATFGHFGQSGTSLWVDRAHSLALVTASAEPFGEWATTAWPALSSAVLSSAVLLSALSGERSERTTPGTAAD
ncbi:CubicO group peptidase, beta-lactamase class C family [Quadrisphaera granulorum]|uniref:CubicO group peptidase (Beta-lactamase class C family) n=1 Tax=Quadrisphaera granulorum TaxID=317664 RepID=A0A316A813_9ACTN|nr:CubicO group peptidase (beta-lactamase class C family) [Quadrisphaera granulorum]SZE97336.1 CubicO group peptidase, beta-lactamase class C family [Quadrisphaera granulorum]